MRKQKKNWAVVASVVGMWAYTASAQIKLTEGAYNFNGGWKVFVGDAKGMELPAFDDRAWKQVTLPHGYNEDDAFRKDITELPTGISWYRKTFRVQPGELPSKKVFLEFQGVRHAGEVWVNGERLALSENGVMAFGVDASKVIREGDNVIAVRCDSAWNYKERATGSPYQWNDRNFYANYGGINKNVILHVKDRLHQTLPLYSSLGTTGVYIYGKDIDVASRSTTLVAESEVRNEHPEAKRAAYEVTVKDLEGKEVGKFVSEPVEIKAGETRTLTASGKLAGLNFWSWGYGYLYTVATDLKVDGKIVDRVETRTGFRKTEFSDGALKLNGRTLQLKGYAQRTTNEWPALGINVPPWLSDFSNGLMVESNGNLVRWMHVTPSKQDVESCDRVGLIQALPAGDSERDPDGRRWELRVELMRDAIIYNRNNPSVIFYEAGNKGISEEHMKEMMALKQKYDPNGGRAMGCREMMGSDTAEWGGEMLYINKSAGKPMWATEYMRDEALRKYADEYTPPFHKNGDGPLHKNASAFSYNRNQDSMAIETVTRWYDYWRERPGTGRRVSGGGVNIIFSDSNTHHRGAENYRRSGEVDAMRLPKEGFFAHKVMWNGWVEVEQSSAHIIGHWNYAPGTVKDVHVVSSAEKVELKLNGKSLGYGEQKSRFLFTFPQVTCTAGQVTALGFDAAGKEVCTAEVQTVGAPAAVRLTSRVSPTGFTADGSDVALIDVEVVDAQGRRCPTALNEIRFEVEGPAEWRGGIAQGPENYILSKMIPVELGINRVIVRSTSTPGTIKVKATSDGLAAAEVRLETKAKTDIGSQPGWDLKPSLIRGPTPTGDSVRISRKPLQVVFATAGSGKENPNVVFDDNEETGWTSEGTLSGAWIKLNLATPETISEITMRPNAWRSRSYPIRILVDDKEVFVGATPRSLGYVTLNLKPTVGKSVTIQLIGPGRDGNDFDMTEITGLKLSAGTTEGMSGKGVFGASEIEIYGPAK